MVFSKKKSTYRPWIACFLAASVQQGSNLLEYKMWTDLPITLSTNLKRSASLSKHCILMLYCFAVIAKSHYFQCCIVTLLHRIALHCFAVGWGERKKRGGQWKSRGRWKPGIWRALMMRIMVRSKRRKIRWLKKGESDRLRISTQNVSQEDNLVNTLRFYN